MRYLILLILILFYSCKTKIVSDDYIPKYTSSQIEQKLERIYQNKSLDSLNLFLSEWHDSIPASREDYIFQNDTIKNIYQLFYEAYCPFKFGKYEAANYFGNDYKYIILQTDIRYGVVSNKVFKSYLAQMRKGILENSVCKYLRIDTLKNFRPQIKYDSAKYLFLTKEYKMAIDSFLGSKHTNVGEGNIMNTAFPKEESYNRYMFLSPTLPIVQGHWGGYWHIATFPIVYSVIFDEDFKNSLVDFRASIGETVYKYQLTRIEGIWKAGENKELWMTQE